MIYGHLPRNNVLIYSLPHYDSERTYQEHTCVFSNVPSSKIISERTLGTCKTYSSSRLGTSTCSKSKDEATKWFKSSCVSKFYWTFSACYLSSTSSRNMISTLLSLVDENQSLVTLTLVVSTLIVLLIFYLYALKLLHRHFDNGK